MLVDILNTHLMKPDSKVGCVGNFPQYFLFAIL